jgi:hypothetical protein
MSKDITQIADELTANIDTIEKESAWAIGEIRRLRAENLELRLKVDNLTYMLRAVTQGKVLQ